jgi:hypothetical protein
MKTINAYLAYILVAFAATTTSAANAQTAFKMTERYQQETFATAAIPADVTARTFSTPPAKTHLDLIYTIPAAWTSKVVITDYENESIFTLVEENKPATFLFSVAKITAAQWMKLQGQIQNYSILENKDGYIVFLQKGKVKNNEMEIMLASLQVK